MFEVPGYKNHFVILICSEESDSVAEKETAGAFDADIW